MVEGSPVILKLKHEAFLDKIGKLNVEIRKKSLIAHKKNFKLLRGDSFSQVLKKIEDYYQNNNRKKG